MDVNALHFMYDVIEYNVLYCFASTQECNISEGGWGPPQSPDTACYTSRYSEMLRYPKNGVQPTLCVIVYMSPRNAKLARLR